MLGQAEFSGLKSALSVTLVFEVGKHLWDRILWGSYLSPEWNADKTRRQVHWTAAARHSEESICAGRSWRLIWVMKICVTTY
jgi:hypothetical protein